MPIPNLKHSSKSKRPFLRYIGIFDNNKSTCKAWWAVRNIVLIFCFFFPDKPKDIKLFIWTCWKKSFKKRPRNWNVHVLNLPWKSHIVQQLFNSHIIVMIYWMSTYPVIIVLHLKSNKLPMSERFGDYLLSKLSLFVFQNKRKARSTHEFALTKYQWIPPFKY